MFKDKIVSFFYLKIFVCIVIVFFVGALLVRMGNEVTGSSFKNNSFSLLIVSKDSKIIFVDKANKSVLFLAVGDIRNFVKGKGVVEASIALGIPINGMIIDSHSPQNLNEFVSSANVTRLILSGESPVFKNLDKYDIYKLTSTIKGSLTDNKHEIRVNIFNQDQMKEKVGDLFKDSVVNNLAYTIEIDNGTTIDGLGTEMAGILSREGFNVIAVRTTKQNTNSYISYPGKSNIYVNSLVGLTDFPIKKEKGSQTADITIYLGDDLDSMLSF